MCVLIVQIVFRVNTQVSRLGRQIPSLLDFFNADGITGVKFCRFRDSLKNTELKLYVWEYVKQKGLQHGQFRSCGFRRGQQPRSDD